VWEKVISLIGYFDLDPNRALDMILDVLSIHLVTHYSFFLALLSFSPWAASYRRPTDNEVNMNVNNTPGLYGAKSLDEVLTLADRHPHETKAQGSSPRGMAQVVGFKFAYYQVRILSHLVLPLIYTYIAPDRRCYRANTEKLVHDRSYSDSRRLHNLGRPVSSFKVTCFAICESGPNAPVAFAQ
jgi:hypothetical protein